MSSQPTSSNPSIFVSSSLEHSSTSSRSWGKKNRVAFLIFGSLALKSKTDVMKGFLKNSRRVTTSSPFNRSRFPYMKKRVTNEPLTESLFSKSGLERFWDKRGDMLLACWIRFLEKRSVKKFSKKKEAQPRVGVMKPPSFVMCCRLYCSYDWDRIHLRIQTPVWKQKKKRKKNIPPTTVLAGAQFAFIASQADPPFPSRTTMRLSHGGFAQAPTSFN